MISLYHGPSSVQLLEKDKWRKMVERQIGDGEDRTSKWGSNVGKQTKRKKHKKATGGLDKGKGKTMTDQDTLPLIASIFWQ